MTENTNNPLVEVFGGSLWEADLVKGLLDANDIPSMLKDESLGIVTSPYNAFGGQIKVLVDENDAPLAQKIIDEREKDQIPEE